MDDKPQCAICHRFLADCYIELGEFDQAIKNTNHYLQLSIENDDKVEQQRAFVTLGRCFLNRAEQMKDGREIMVNLKSASHAFISSIKLISDLTTLLDVCQLGEMRAVSLLNLGQVLRGLRDHASAKERFLQCVSLARKYGLHKLLFRACYQLYDMAVSDTQLNTIAPCSRSFFLDQLNKSPLHKALEVVRLALRSSLSKSCSDIESKDLLRNLKEAYANIYLALGQFRKAAKIYRLLKLDSPISSDVCRKFIQKSICDSSFNPLIQGILLSDQMQSLPEVTPVSVEEYISVSKKHERLGDLYTSVELHGPALLHYQFMLSYAEHAYQFILTKSGSAVFENDTTIKLVDAALVSVAEAHRTLGDYDQCAQVYKREIQWSTSKGLSTADLAGSWFSLAQAQRLCFPEFSTSVGDWVIVGSECTLNTLTSALQASKQSGSMKLTKEILFEMEDYCKCHNLSEQAASLQKELSNYTQDSDPEQLDISQVEEAPEYSDDTVVDEDLVTQFIEALSSDSEVESCVGHVEILDELHGERRGTRKGRALCLKTNMKGETPLHVAAIHGDMDHVIKLIEVLSHPVNVVDGAGWLPIHEAAFHDRTEVAVYLLDRGARLDDPGCPLDASTPLFEAVHNGSLNTALMLVQRGANLWHRNKRGECLPELLDSWQPTRRCVGTFGQQREVFDQLLNAIRERLGRDYDRWCNQQRSSPRDHASTSSSPTSSHGSPSNTMLSPPRVKHRRQPRSPSLSDLDSRTDKPNRHRDLRCQDWEELLVDLDATQATSSYVRKGVNRNTRKPNAVQAYKEAMQAIASSSSRSKKRTVSESQPDCSPKQRKKKRATPQIAMDDENWLVNDECPGTSKQKTNRTVRSQLELRNVRLSDKPAIKSDTASSAVSGSRIAPLCDISHLQNTGVDFSPRAAVFTSTQMPNDSTSKTTGTPPPPLPHSPTLSAQPVSAVTSVVPPLSAVHPVERADRMPSNSQPVQSARGTHGPFSIKVAFTDISVLVPVDDSSRSVSWLANEAYRRRQILTSAACSTTPDRHNCVRLSTRDGALLLPTDRLLSVVPGLNQSGQVIELLAELIDETADPPATLLHPPAVAPQLVVGLPNSYNTSLGHIQVGGEIPGDGGRCGLIVSSQFFKTLLDRSRQTSILDLRYLALGDVECCLIVTQVVRHGVRSITELYLQGNGLQLSLPSPDTSSSAQHSPLSVTIGQLATQVTRLDLDSNAISLHGLMQFLDQLNQIANTDSHSTCTVLLPRLQRISLAHNWFLGASDVKGETEDYDSALTWLSLIGRFVVAFPKLAHLNLSGCGLGLKQNSYGRTVTLPPSPVSNLSELDLSWNPYLPSESLFTVLSSGCLAGLRSLSLRGCALPAGQTLLTTLPVTSAQVTESRWLTSGAKKQDVLTTDLSNPLPSSGDGIVRTLSTVILQGLFRLQRLDLGYCQLTNHCLTDLTKLFDTPGTSLTTIQLDHNPNLTGHISPGWSDVLRATALPSSALVSLTIDMPNVNDDTDDSLAAAITAVEMKLLPGLCSTPLQELVLDGAPCDWHPPKPLMNIKFDRVKQGVGTLSAFSNSHRFCNALSSLFTARFGSLANHKIGHNRICFGIL
ncbi:hypothetical protein EG68_06775 [Paragonimus skrjabini miyazakii]|uniref:Tonsoku-like protein n=1 Tax=Paragonimus skrjabini miyazakii TaxID=59628 RepID=A0A8S9YTN3_9TREM|nr:hypothetical protein EG68_06775 [Paragonimus skrjabini miyazakii]